MNARQSDNKTDTLTVETLTTALQRTATGVMRRRTARHVDAFTPFALLYALRRITVPSGAALYCIRCEGTSIKINFIAKETDNGTMGVARSKMWGGHAWQARGARAYNGVWGR